MSDSKLIDACIFCKIIRGEIPSYKVYETELSYAFLDINPLSKGHTLVIPKCHAQKMHQLPDEYLADAMPVAKKVAIATGAVDFNILQNNGLFAHQFVEHVHFHVIPKHIPSDLEGLVVGWPARKANPDELKETVSEMSSKL